MTSIKTNARSIQTREVFCKDGLWVHWADGQRSVYPYGFLRRNCLCAGCVDELSGVRRSWQGDESSLRAEHCEYVGNYALRLRFSDGHGSGIYPFQRLREWFEAAKAERFPAGGPQAGESD